MSTTANFPAMLMQFMAPILEILKQPGLTEVCVNRPDEVWTEDKGGWKKHTVSGLSLFRCQQIANLIATANGKAIDEHSPVLSASLPNGERVQVVIPPACEKGTVSITVRKPSDALFTLDALHEFGAFNNLKKVKLNYDANALNSGFQVTTPLSSDEQELLAIMEKEGTYKWVEFLKKAVLAKRNILLVGKTGSGKTTMTNSLISEIPESERLITIEDARELRLPNHGNSVHLIFARESEGGIAISAKDALASCLRMKPDRILLAELRGDESWEFIKSINTGHPGSISTMHANGAFEAFEQLASFVKDSETGSHLEMGYIKHRLMTTVDITLFMDNKQALEIFYEPEFKRQAMA